MTAWSRPVGVEGRARAVVLVALWSNVLWAVGVPGWLVTDSLGGGRAVAAWLALIVHGAVHAVLLRSVVTPWVEERTRRRLGVALLLATILVWPLLAGGGSTDEPWAWLAGFTVGALVVTRPALAGVAAVGGVILLALGAAWWDTSFADGLTYAAIAGSASGGLALLVVWMLRLVVAAEDGRAAEARLAVAQERLRVSRDLHDVLGHRLGVIALRAELSGDTETQELARSTLGDVRAAVHDYGTVDLPEQLSGARLVLGSAGIETEVEAHGTADLPAATSQVLAAAVREAVTNVLRHSDAGHCHVGLRREGGLARLIVVNDGAPERETPDGTGLSGLADRARLVGGTIRTERRDGVFRLEVEVPDDDPRAAG